MPIVKAVKTAAKTTPKKPAPKPKKDKPLPKKTGFDIPRDVRNLAKGIAVGTAGSQVIKEIYRGLAEETGKEAATKTERELEKMGQ